MQELTVARRPDQPETEPSEARLAKAFLAGDAGELIRELGPEGVFHGPVASYAGPAQTQPVLTALLGVLKVQHVTALHLREPETACFFTAEIAGHRADGAFRALARKGRPPEVTLMVRPLDALLAGVARIRSDAGG